MGDERRMNVRYPYIEQVTIITLTGKSCIVKSVNLSIGGVFIITDEYLPLDSEGSITIVVNQNNEKKCVSAEFIVVHNDDFPQGKKGIGIEFTNIDIENKRLLRELILFLDEK